LLLTPPKQVTRSHKPRSAATAQAPSRSKKSAATKPTPTCSC
jgi:hypothetical protein